MASLQLVFPPLTGVNYPYLSTPSLMAYVLENSSHPVSQIDLNMAVVDWLLQPQTVGLWIERAKAILARFKGREIQGQEVVEYARAASLAVRGEALRAALPTALQIIRTKDALADPAQMAYADKVIAEALQAASIAHPPEIINLTEPVWLYSASSPSELRAGVEDQKNLIYSIYDQMLSLADFTADVVGISIVYHGQVLPALCFAAWLKRRRPDVRIIAGGPFFTVHRDRLAAEPWLFDWLDAICVFEGEKALVGYLDCVDGATKCALVPGLIWRQYGMVLNSGTPEPVDMAYLPCPNFDGLPLDAYHLPERTLPLLASRGCYWRCAFCTHHYIYGDSYRIRSPTQLADDMARLARQWDCRHIYFADESMSPRLLRHISSTLLESDSGIRWGCELRAEKSLTPQDLDAAFRSGCRVFSFGVESTNQRVLDSMGKGIAVHDIERIFNHCHKAGIHAHFMGIIGFPGETEEENNETFAFIERNHKVIDLAGFSYFYLLRHSPVDRHPEQFFLDGVADLRPDLRFEERRRYSVLQGLSMAQSFDRWNEKMSDPDFMAIALKHGHATRDRFLFSPGAQEISLSLAQKSPLPVNDLLVSLMEFSHDLTAALVESDGFFPLAARRYNLEGVTLWESWKTLATPPLQPLPVAALVAFAPKSWTPFVLDPMAACLLLQLHRSPAHDVLAHLEDAEKFIAQHHINAFVEAGLMRAQ